MSIAHWTGTIKRAFVDKTADENDNTTVELNLDRNGLQIIRLDMKDQEYMFTMCKKAVDTWVLNNPGDPDHAIKLVNNTLKRYKTKIETNGDQFIIDYVNNVR